VSDLEVAYISGAPRSGTTLLGMILGQLRDFCDVGELWALWRPAFRNGDLCGCGLAVRECPFWLAVVRRAVGPDYGSVGPALGDLHRQWMGTTRAPLVWLHQRGWRRRAAYDEYAAALGRHYRAIAEVSGARVVVDSSKMASDALLASGLPGISLSVIHCVRDPRGVAWSWQKQARQPGPDGRPLDQHGSAASAARWVAYNALARTLVAPRLGERFRTVRYEDLIADPIAVTRYLASWLGADPDGLPLSDDPPRLRRSRPSHPVWGNPVRTSTGDIPLRADDEWTRRLGRSERATTTVVTLPYLLRYGYPAWPVESEEPVPYP
jgi:hypothetical protein